MLRPKKVVSNRQPFYAGMTIGFLLQAACYSPLPVPIRKQPTSDGVVVAIVCNNDDGTRRKPHHQTTATNQRWRDPEAQCREGWGGQEERQQPARGVTERENNTQQNKVSAMQILIR